MNQLLVLLAVMMSPAIAAPANSIVPHSPNPMPIVQTQTDSDDWSTLLDRARDYEAGDRYAEAERLYRQILTPPRPDSMNDRMYYVVTIQLGENLQEQGKFAEAIAIFEELLDVPPEGNEDIPVRARYGLDTIAELQKTAEERIPRGLQAIETDPTDPWGYRDLVLGLAIQNRLEEGLTFLEERLGRPLSPEQALEVARAAASSTISSDLNYLNWSRFPIKQQAIKLYRQLVARYPSDRAIRAEFLDVLNVWGPPEEAIAAYRAAIEELPSESWYWGLARKLESAEQPAEAIAVYEQIIDLGSIEPQAYVVLGSLLEQTQQSDRELQTYLQGIERFPEDRPSDRRCHVVKTTNYDSLVRFLEKQNRLEETMAAIEQLSPNFTAEAYENLAIALEYENHPDLAAMVYRQLSDRYPDAEISGGGGCY